MIFIKPDWPAPQQICGYTTTRLGGISKSPYNDFNLGAHVGDDEQAVLANRKSLKAALNLASEPKWLNQTHSVVVTDWNSESVDADACYTNQPNQVCVSMTADCLPILLCNKTGTEVAAIHAGWKGLGSGVIEATLDRFESPAHEILAWFGPAIGPQAFEVGSEVYELFTQKSARTALGFKVVENTNQWLANVYVLATQCLYERGVSQIYGGEHCTLTDKEHFYSYRRDKTTGRMASLIWISKSYQPPSLPGSS